MPSGQVRVIKMFEFVIILIAVILMLAVLSLFAVYVLPIVAAIAVLTGLAFALKNYVLAIVREMNFRSWAWRAGDEPAKRSYFFGPGYVQLALTIIEAFSLNIASGKKLWEFGDVIRGTTDGFWGLLRGLAAFAFKLTACISIYVIGTALCVVLGLVHGSITTAFMVLFYIIFMVVWLIDRIYLIKNKIRSDCPNCHKRFLVPYFQCPQCFAVHKRLVPGPYGVWRHKCSCGYKLPSTFFNGRSKLNSLCPLCVTPLVDSGARPIVFQLVGGSKAGKTVYLSAFFHQYFEKLDRMGVPYVITEEYKPYFDELAQWYQGGDCPATAQLNSQMYPVLIDSKAGVRRQFSIYDIAGEMFDGVTADNEIQQEQFHYCDGILFLLDPFSSGRLRQARMDRGGVDGFSDMAVENVAENFINYLIRTGHAKTNARCGIPVSVLIAKADVPEVKQAVGPAKIRRAFQQNPELYQTLEQARDGECRQFLIDIGLSAAVDNLEAQFPNLHYFPVSAMGHSPDGSAYEPWGVADPVEWILSLADKALAGVLKEEMDTQSFPPLEGDGLEGNFKASEGAPLPAAGKSVKEN